MLWFLVGLIVDADIVMILQFFFLLPLHRTFNILTLIDFLFDGNQSKIFFLNFTEERTAQHVDIVNLPDQPDVVEIIDYFLLDLPHSDDIVADVAAGG